jgi:hypothetical protein
LRRRAGKRSTVREGAGDGALLASDGRTTVLVRVLVLGT